ncbi:hypothetical protein ACIGCM_03610 [Pseudomonas sp. NPDC078700]|uniref:hypothetical protein n=1 Tax=Pseudomonas sp. NPDC078700 TaxID=3364424 RepID=UPI0037C5314D
MSNPSLMLGGVPFVLEAGSFDQSSNALGGSGVVRLSLGEGVKMTHWSKASGSISSNDAWMPPGLAGLDYSEPLELRLTKPMSITGTDLEVALKGNSRPDSAPWVLALVSGDWVQTDSTYSAGVVTITPVAGASLYATYWLPMYEVFASEPPESMGGGVYGWTINWEEA